MTRRELLAGTVSLAPSALAQKKDKPKEKKKNAGPVLRPNILFILADDLASWMLGSYGNKEIRTPHMDQLARLGTRFSNHFVATPICSASRATIFTGRMPRQHGIHDFLTDSPIAQPPQGQKDVPDSFSKEVMLSELLAQQAGYRCGYVGKWHMGQDRKPGRGFEYSYTMLGGSRSYTDPEMSLNGEMVQEKGYLAELMTKRAAEFLSTQSASKPFFLTVGYLNPHTPYDGHPQKYYDMYAGKLFDTFGWENGAPNALREKEMLKDIPGNLRKAAAATTALDDQVGALLKVLDDRKLRDNTLIILAGDNGYLLGRHGLWSKGLASDPINMYEEVMQVPMIWSWPGRVPPTSVRPELIATYDLLPTLCDFTGIDVPERNLPGRSYRALVEGKIYGQVAKYTKERPWRDVVYGGFRNTDMMRDNRFKLVLRDNGQGPGDLFDIVADPREKVNQYANPQFLTVRERMTKELLAWREKHSS